MQEFFVRFECSVRKFPCRFCCIQHNQSSKYVCLNKNFRITDTSVACGQANSYNLPVGEYLRLGNPASHGCIRACVADAKWVWDNCNGSKIHIFDGTYTSNEALKGPLGRKALTPLRGSKNFDPTDPACK